MADLRSRFIEDYAGGLLNISRQEVSATGEVLSQDGFTPDGTIFVEDGSGVKSGLKLGVSLAESLDPTTETGIVNVRFADRTYAKIRDLKIFSTAIASTQAALSDAVSTSISNLENAFEFLEDDIGTLESNLINNINENRDKIQALSVVQNDTINKINTLDNDLVNLTTKVNSITTERSENTEIPGNLVVKKNTTLSTVSVSGQIEVSEVKEKVGIMEGLDINPANGSVQFKVIESGSVSLTQSFEEGQTVVLMLEKATGASVGFPAGTVWVSHEGNTLPTLSTKDTLVFWKAGGSFFGAHVGSYE